MTAVELLERWRAQAAEYDRDGQPGAALLRRVAGELEAALTGGDDECLPLPAAAAVSGYSIAHLRRLVAADRLTNVGTNGRICLRRGDLPRKPGASSAGPDLVAAVLPLPARAAPGRRR